MQELIYALAKQVGNRLQGEQESCAVAESCTGGLLAAAITAIPMSSQWFDRGFVTYSNAAKVSLLGVPAALIETDGAVSESVASAMVQGALASSDADVAVAITGIAGPSGGTKVKPVGTVWIAWGRTTGRVITQGFIFKGDRLSIRDQAVQAALTGLMTI